MRWSGRWTAAHGGQSIVSRFYSTLPLCAAF
ncbi:hypothetical protein DIPPA_70039 [Diplonema papillatum]|nr:hypothetical protein DIPPA_70039 [Diplonema papillatum]